MIDYKNQKYKVVVVTPAGRKKFLSIFKKFIYRKMDEGLIDGWQLWLNTVSQERIDYIESMEKENPKVKVYRLDESIIPNWDTCNSLQTHKFSKFAQDNDTIYIRFDDDIIWVEEGAIRRILEARIDAHKAFVIYPNIINSTICTSWHQEIKALSEEAGVVNREMEGNPNHAYLDAFNYTDSKLIDHIHSTFRKRYEEKTLSAYYLPNKFFEDYKRFSIACICWWGKDKVSPGENEEAQLSWELPQQLNRPVFFVGDALMVHYNYHTQRDYLAKGEKDKDSHLNFYRRITK